MPVNNIPTPLSTRWASVVNTLTHMLNYRSAVDKCFRAQSVRLQARLPTPQDWIVMAAVVSIMSPVMNVLIHKQTRSFFVLSDAVIKMIELHKLLSAQLSELLDDSSDSTDPPLPL